MKSHLSFTLLLIAIGCVQQAVYAQDQAQSASLSAATSDAAEAPAKSQTLAPLGAPDKTKVAPLGSPKSAAVAPLGAPKKPAAALGKPGKPKFALKTTGMGGAGAAAPDREAEVKRLIDAYHNIAIRFADRMILAKTPEDIEQAKRHEPSARALRPVARLIAEIVAVDQTDEPALDAMLFLSKYVGVPLIDETLAKAVFADGTQGFDINAMILEHHADNPKVAKALRSWPKSPETDQFLLDLFEKSHNPQVRASSGINLVNNLQRNEQTDYALQLAKAMAADHYLDGVPTTSRPTGPTARGWAAGKVREIELVSVGKVLPEVSGETLEGEVEQISDYRGKVVVFDVWTTWCGPCVAMIPHQNEMVEKFRDEPYQMISVSCDAERETLENFLETKEMPWKHWWVGQDSPLQESLNVRIFPTIIVLDAKGVIRHKNIKEEELEAAVEELLKEAKEEGDPT